MANLTFRRGDTSVYTIGLVKQDLSPLDLTGATVWLTVKPSYLGDPADADKVFGWYWVSGGANYGITVPSPTSGVLTLTIIPADTLGKAVGPTWPYDIQILDSLSRVFTWDEGTVTLTPDVTQRLTTP